MLREVLSTDAYSGTVLISGNPSDGLPTPAEDPLIGVALSSAYRIERVIGEGAMGLLYEASHLRLDRRFAVKVLHQPLAQRDDMRARFEREARVMSRIKSDHVVDVVDVTAAPDGRTCIVTELLDGSDLEQHLARRGGRLPYAEGVSLIRQCLLGLSAAHALGVVHRDLKPSNLFLAHDAGGRVALKVLDFGIAKIGGDAELTAAGTIMGTPAYMAPEQARSANQADARSDLYSVGAVLYRTLTGRPPYEDSDVNSTLIRLIQEAPVRPRTLERSIPPGLEAIIERAMARDPAQRYQSAAELDADLAVFDVGPPALEAGVSSAGEPAPTPLSRTLSQKAQLVRPLAVGAGVALALCAGAAVTASLALLVNGLSKLPRLGATELLLVAIAGAATVIGVLTASVRALRRGWRNAAEVSGLSRCYARGTLAFAATLGLLELATRTWSTLGERLPTLHDPLLASLHITLALAVGGALVWRGAPARSR